MPKPSLSVTPAKTAEQLAALYKQLTGKEMSPEKLAEARKRLAKIQKR